MWGGYEEYGGVGRIEVCDLCHDEIPVRIIIFTGRQFLCPKCYGGITQESESRLDKAGVGGANPSATTKVFLDKTSRPN